MARRIAFFLRTACIGSSLAALALVACTSSSATPSLAQATSDFATAYCTRLGACSSFAVESAYGDMPTCVTVNTNNGSLAAKAPGSGATAAALEACAQAYSTVDCGVLASEQRPAACELVGTVADGAECADGLQCGAGRACVSGLTALPDGGVSCGTCARYAAAGEPCTFPGPGCAPGLACLALVPADGGARPAATCVALGQEGAACGGGGTLPSCDPRLACVQQTCSAPLEAAAACDPFSDGCDRFQGLQCDPTLKTCVKIPIASPGAPCGDVSSANAICGGVEVVCTAVAGSATRTCVAALAVGQPCDVAGAGSDFCQVPSTCVANVCTLPDPTACH